MLDRNGNELFLGATVKRVYTDHSQMRQGDIGYITEIHDRKSCDVMVRYEGVAHHMAMDLSPDFLVLLPASGGQELPHRDKKLLRLMAGLGVPK